MARVTRARKVALSLLGEIRRRDARARDVLRSAPAMEELDARDRAFVSRLVLGVVGSRGLLDSVLRAYVRGGVEPQVLDALRLSAYELLFLSTAPSAAVSQGVELVRGLRPRAAGMANAVLRRVAQQDVPRRVEALARVQAAQKAGLTVAAEKNEPAEKKRSTEKNEPVDKNVSVEMADPDGRTVEDEVEDLALVSGYPAWLLERVRDDRGELAARELALSSLEPAPVYVAANVARLSSEEAADLLEAKGLEPVPADEELGLVGSFALHQPAGLMRSGLVEDVDVVVADLSAQRVVAHAGVRPGMRVLEIGQGRGTKSVLLENAALSQGDFAHVVGVDSEAYKVGVATRRMERAGLAEQVTCVAHDARRLADSEVPPELLGAFDLVFVDAPCSGTGTLRRHPEIAWALDEKALNPACEDSLPRLQLDILKAATSRVREGGRLVYATCSIMRAENEDVVERFLASEEGSDFVLEDAPFQSLPSTDGPDGHFCATFVRS